MPPAAIIMEAHPRPPDEQFREHMGKISGQSSVFFAGTIFTAIAGYLFKVYIARKIGAEALGIYAMGMTVVGLAGVIGAIGLPQSAGRFVAAYAGTGQFEKLRGFLWRSLASLILLNIVISWVVVITRRWIASNLYHTPQLASYMIFFVVIMFVGVFTSFAGQTLAGYKDVSLRTIVTNFVGTPLNMALTVILLTLGFGLRGYLLAQVASALSVLLLLTWAVRRLTPLDVRSFRGSPARFEPEVLSFSVVLLGTQVLEFLLAQTDRIALGVFLNARYLGIYSIASALTAFVPIVLQSVNQIFSPTIAELHARRERELLLRLYRTITKWTLGLTIPLALTMIVFARPLMAIFGSEFTVGWPVLVIGTIGQLVNGGVGSVGLLLFMSGQQVRAIRVQIIATPVIVALNFLLVPVWGLAGAALVSSFANVLMNLLYLREVRINLKLTPSLTGYLSLLWPTLAAFAAILFSRFAMKGLRLQTLVAVVAALVLAYLVFGLCVMAAGIERDDQIFIMGATERVKGAVRRFMPSSVSMFISL